MFLHEIGHALQLKATKGRFKVPESFKKEISNHMFPDEGKDMLPEIFADCFTIFLMHNTKFENKNPFIKALGEKRIELLEGYFQWLIKEI